MTAASVLVAGGVLAAGMSIAQLSLGDESATAGPSSSVTAEPSPTSAQDRPDTVELADKDRNGVADVLEDEPKKPRSPATATDGTTPPKDGGKLAPLPRQDSTPEPTKGPAVGAQIYIIEEGDTLSAISGKTGVPVGYLVEANKIQNPNLIYAGASLLISPVG